MRKPDVATRRKQALVEVSVSIFKNVTPGVNFTKIIRAAFYRADPKSAKKTVNLSSFAALLGSACVKSAHRTLVKLTPGRDKRAEQQKEKEKKIGK